MKSYIANIDGWVAGQRVAKGDLVVLTDAQAQYEPVTPVQNPATARSDIGATMPPSLPVKPRRKAGRQQ